jgi:predicted PurR-regulated permease PerM
MGVNMNVDAADRNFQKNAMASFIQIGALALLLVWCFRILSPFLGLVMWALIIAVAIYPLHVSLTARLGGREKLAAAVFVLVGMAILIVPTYLTMGSSISGLTSVGTDLKAGNVTIPAPDPSVADWPIIGKKVFSAWSNAAVDLEETLRLFQPQLVSLGEGMLRSAGSMVLGILLFAVSLVIAGVFLVSARGGYRTALTLSASLVGERGAAFTDLIIATIRSVTKGVLGVAVIQAVLSAIGLVVMNVPGAGIWAGLILILAIVQLPTLIILGPISFWVFSVAEPVPAMIFAIYSIVVSLSDTVLKPMLLGRGVEVPALVILLGAIGGAILMGIMGLFVGAVVLALGYEILRAWMETDELNNPKKTAEETTA